MSRFFVYNLKSFTPCVHVKKKQNTKFSGPFIQLLYSMTNRFWYLSALKKFNIFALCEPRCNCSTGHEIRNVHTICTDQIIVRDSRIATKGQSCAITFCRRLIFFTFLTSVCEQRPRHDADTGGVTSLAHSLAGTVIDVRLRVAFDELNNSIDPPEFLNRPLFLFRPVGIFRRLEVRSVNRSTVEIENDIYEPTQSRTPRLIRPWK